MIPNRKPLRIVGTLAPAPVCALDAEYVNFAGTHRALALPALLAYGKALATS
jgi:hypothetical protein